MSIPTFRSSFRSSRAFLLLSSTIAINACGADNEVDAPDDSMASGGAGGANDASSELPAYPLFAPFPNDRSVLDSGRADQPLIVTDPTVYADSEGYHLFFTTLFCRTGNEAPTWIAVARRTCVDTPKGSTAYAFSSDGGHSWKLRETPVVYPRAGNWDSGDIEAPFATRLGNELVLLYCAFGRIESRFEIGAASLANSGESVRRALLDEGRTFLSRDAPLIPANFVEPGAVNNAQEPSMVVNQDSLDVYYVGIGLTRPDLGFVEGQAPTGIALRRRRFDLQLNAVAGSDESLLSGINIAEVREIGEKLHLFSTSMEDSDYHRGERILWRQSADRGASWSDPVEALGFGHGMFDNWGVMAPALVLEERRAVLFFTAWESTDQPCGASGRFGMPYDESGSSGCLFATLGRAETRMPQ